MQTLITDFGRGIDTRGLHALPDSVAALKNLTVRNGSAQVTGLSQSIDTRQHAYAAMYAGDAESISYINDTWLVKQRSLIWRAHPIRFAPVGSGMDLRMFYIPLWPRTSIGTTKGAAVEPETVTTMHGQTLFSLMPKDDVPGLNSFNDACIAWGGHSAVWPVTYDADDSTVSYDQWNSGTLIPALETLAVTPQPGWWMWYGTYDPDSLTVTWRGRVRVLAATAGTNPGDAFVCRTEKVGQAATMEIAAFVDADPIGIPKPTATPVAALFTSTTTYALPPGTYRYYARYVSSTRNIAGVLSEPSSPLEIEAASTGATLALAETPGDNLPYWVDGVEFYRQMLDSESGEWGVAELATIYSLTETSGGLLAKRHHPTGDMGPDCYDEAAAGDLLPGDAYWPVRPGVLTHVRNYAGRLYGVDGTNRNVLRFSTMNAPHSWPEGIADATSYEDMLWTGGSVSVGDNTPIYAIVPEGSAFSDTGTRGESLLIVKEDRSHRWTGINWEDFYLSDSFDVGTVDGTTVRNCNGRVFLVGLNDLLTIEPGSATPTHIGMPLWPNGIPATAAGVRWSAVYWNDHYVFSNATNTYALDTVRMAFFELTHSPLLTTGREPGGADRTTDLMGMSLAGELSTYIRSDGYEHASPWRIRTAIIPMLSDVWSVASLKHVRRVTVGVTNLYTPCPIIVRLIGDGGKTLATKNVVLPKVTDAPYQSVTVAFNSPPGVKTRFVQVELESEPGHTHGGLTIEWIGIDYDVKRKDRADVL